MQFVESSPVQSSPDLASPDPHLESPDWGHAAYQSKAETSGFWVVLRESLSEAGHERKMRLIFLNDHQPSFLFPWRGRITYQSKAQVLGLLAVSRGSLSETAQENLKFPGDPFCQALVRTLVLRGPLRIISFEVLKTFKSTQTPLIGYHFIQKRELYPLKQRKRFIGVEITAYM